MISKQTSRCTMSARMAALRASFLRAGKPLIQLMGKTCNKKNDSFELGWKHDAFKL